MRRAHILFMILCMASLLAIAGCGQKTWYKYGVTQYEFEMDKKYCLFESEKFTYVDSGYSPNLSQALASGIADGINSAMRKDNLFTLCMETKGYSLLSKKASSRIEAQSVSVDNQFPINDNPSQAVYSNQVVSNKTNAVDPSQNTQQTQLQETAATAPQRENPSAGQYRTPRKPFVPMLPSDFED